MVDDLTWLRQLGEQVCLSYAASPKVAATALGGSVARGWADQHSDIEVFVFWAQAPTDEERVAAVSRSGGGIDVDWSTADADQKWASAFFATSGRVSELWPLEDDEWSEHYYLDKTHVGVNGFLVSMIDDWVDGLVVGNPNDAAEMVAATIIDRAHVTGEDLLLRWARKLEPYPELLARANIDNWLQRDERWWDVDRLASRGDRPAFDAVAIAMQQRLIRLLLAINGIYLPDPRPKWVRRLVEECDIKPKSFLKRLELAQVSLPRESAFHLQDLLDDTLEVIDDQFPTVDVNNARKLYRHRRTVHKMHGQ